MTLPSDPTTPLSELIERVERAEGPDREIDAAICALTKDYSEKEFYRFAGTRPKGTPAPTLHDFLLARLSSRYTASIDAIVGLIERELPGWYWRAGHVPNIHWLGSRGVAGWAFISRTDASNALPGDEHPGWGTTPPLALCVAFLRALSARGGK